MKGLITDIQRFSTEDGPGIRTTVFLKGCNLDCHWCHNPETKKPYPQPQTIAGATSTCGKEIAPEELLAAVLRDKPFYQRSGGGVTFSGGEPLLQLDFLAECLGLCKAKGLHTAVDTAGHVPFSSFDRILPDTDLFLYDVKMADPVLHKRYTGVSNELILENLRRLCGARAGDKPEIVVRTLLLPDVTDNEENFLRLGRLLHSLPGISQAEVLPYHSLGEGKYAAIGEECRYTGKQPPTGGQVAHFQSLLSRGMRE